MVILTSGITAQWTIGIIGDHRMRDHSVQTFQIRNLDHKIVKSLWRMKGSQCGVVTAQYSFIANMTPTSFNSRAVPSFHQGQWRELQSCQRSCCPPLSSATFTEHLIMNLALQGSLAWRQTAASLLLSN